LQFELELAVSPWLREPAMFYRSLGARFYTALFAKQWGESDDTNIRSEIIANSVRSDESRVEGSRY
jgi:hypothetical protein